MAARSALAGAPRKTAGGLLLVAGTTIVMGIITAEVLYTAPYNARMEISDLGASETGVILQPSATIFNGTMLAAGAMIIAGAWFAHQALHRRAVTIPTGLLGIGVLGVGVFPGDIHPQHPLSAFMAFVAGGLAVLLSAGGVERWMFYPILLWLVGFGGYLTASHTADLSGASRPDTAARSLAGHREDARSFR